MSSSNIYFMSQLTSYSISANLIDIRAREIYAARVTVSNHKIVAIDRISDQVNNYILPGFIDAHIHIESSMLLPSAFAQIAVQHGTVATVSDPHEIANVCGVDGIHYMVANGNKVPFKFNFGAPSCVPATAFETAGATIDSGAIAQLLAMPEIKYLSEMMNYPGVLFEDKDVMAKIGAAQKANKPIDGHAPGLMGRDAEKYIGAGISTDHECYTYEEALYKLQHGMKVLIREGSAARNFSALHPLIPDHTAQLMFCCDDKHPDELLLHHINKHVRDAIALGYNLFDVLQIACINPVEHYRLDVGTLRVGDAADFIVVKDCTEFEIVSTYIDGVCVFENGRVDMPQVIEAPINTFNIGKKQVSDFALAAPEIPGNIAVIEAVDGELITNWLDLPPTIVDGFLQSNTSTDVLKIVVVNRYFDAPIAAAFIKSFGLQQGAIASTVGHDCHNIIAVGVTDEDICLAVNALIDAKGGVCAVIDSKSHVLPLPVAGLMSLMDAHSTAAAYQEIDAIAKQLGCTLRAPFMTLSFMALLVIPKLKLSDKGLFDGDKFEFV
jgi:adenine deaminase